MGKKKNKVAFARRRTERRATCGKSSTYHQEFLGVPDLSIFQGERGVRRNVFKPFRECQRQSTGWVHVSEQDLRDGFSGSVTQVPCVDYARDRVHPGHGDRRSGLCDHDGVLVDFRYPLDKLVGSSRKSERFSVVAFRLEICIKTDDSDHDVRLPGQLHRLVNEIVRVVNLCTTEPDARGFVRDILVLVAVCRTTDVAELDVDLVAFICLEAMDATFFYRTEPEEVLSATLAGPIVDHQVTVHPQLLRGYEDMSGRMILAKLCNEDDE